MGPEIDPKTSRLGSSSGIKRIYIALPAAQVGHEVAPTAVDAVPT
jgi:hypothetical protein